MLEGRAMKFADKIRALKWGFVLRWVLMISLATPFVVATALAPAVGRPLYDWLLFHPSRFAAVDYACLNVNGIKPLDVYFKSASGINLHGFLFQVPGATKIFLYSHGNGSNVVTGVGTAAMLMRTGGSVFSYDYAGYGRSYGTPSTEEVIQDAAGAYQYLVQTARYAPKQIVLFGESLGTLPTGNLAKSVACAGVILECPIYSLRRIGCDLIPYLDKYPDWAWTEGERELDNSVAIAKNRAPLLIVAGTADKLTPVQYADDLYALAAAPKRYIRINGAGHVDLALLNSTDYARGLRDFLQELK
jgi:fermentation-respiration switch protein FrsA (DUF1100 family)